MDGLLVVVLTNGHDMAHRCRGGGRPPHQVRSVRRHL